MIERLRQYIEEEFSGIEVTKEISDFLKDELLANLVDKYVENRDLGYSEDKSFIEAVKSIGDLKDIINSKKVVKEERLSGDQHSNYISKPLRF